MWLREENGRVGCLDSGLSLVGSHPHPPPCSPSPGQGGYRQAQGTLSLLARSLAQEHIQAVWPCGGGTRDQLCRQYWVGSGPQAYSPPELRREHVCSRPRRWPPVVSSKNEGAPRPVGIPPCPAPAHFPALLPAASEPRAKLPLLLLSLSWAGGGGLLRCPAECSPLPGPGACHGAHTQASVPSCRSTVSHLLSPPPAGPCSFLSLSFS